MRMSGGGRKRKERRDDDLPKPFAAISLSMPADAHWDVNKEDEKRKSDLYIYTARNEPSPKPIGSLFVSL